MTSAAGPWSVKGIDPKAREIAKDLARRSGMTLGEWLNQMIIEGEPEAPPFERRPPVREAADRPSPDRRSYADPFHRLREAVYADDEDHDGEIARVTQALEALSARMEAAEHRSTLAISGIDQHVMGVLSRLEGSERDNVSVAARFDGALQEIRETQTRLSERARRLEQEDAGSAEAMKALEAALSKVAAQIYEGETRARVSLNEVREDVSGIVRRVDRLEAPSPEREQAVADSVFSRIADRLSDAEQRTSAALHALEASFAGLDSRLSTNETKHASAEVDTAERRFERLALDLTEKVESARAEMAERIRGAADGKLDRMEVTLRELAGQVEQAERRSAQSIDRMGREVMRVAQTLGQRVETVETRSSEAAQQVGSEIARIADAMEGRMRQADTLQAEAMEKLGSEIARIAERLADRISGAERRSAQAADEVGEQLGKVADRINERYDRAAGDLAERIRLSEERTAKLVQEARETLDKRLTDNQRRAVMDAVVQADAFSQRPPEPPPGAAFASPFGQPQAAPFAGGPFAAAPFADDPFTPRSPAFEPDAQRFEPPSPFGRGELEPGEAFEAVAPEPAAEPEPELLTQSAITPAAAEPDLHDAYAFAPEDEFIAEAPAPQGYAQPSEPPRASSTREMIENARAAAREASGADPRNRKGRSAAAAASVPAPAYEPEAAGGKFGFRFGAKKKKKEGSTLRTALLASGTAATLSMAVAGYGLMNAGRAGGDHDQTPIAPRTQAEAAPATAAPPATDTSAELTPPTAGDTGTPDILATAVSPAAGDAATATGGAKTPTAKAAAASPTPATATPNTPAPANAASLYSAAVRQIESGDATGLDPLRRAANLGYAQAQFYLAKLYETGGAGLTKDLVEARRWTERAALAGDPKAMHNLGLDFFEGTGGAKNVTTAADWFRKAADLCLGDSQYNLARLYEQGYGVAQNPAEAYKWYLVAGAGGDTESRSGADRTRKLISAEAQAAAERSAASLRAQSCHTATTGIASAR